MRLTLRYYENVKDYLHPHIRQFIHHYRFGDIIDLPLYHGCNCVNKNGTRKQIYRLIFTGQGTTHRLIADICLKIELIWFIITNSKNTNICLTLQCGGNFII